MTKEVAESAWDNRQSLQFLNSLIPNEKCKNVGKTK